MKDFV